MIAAANEEKTKWWCTISFAGGSALVENDDLLIFYSGDIKTSVVSQFKEDIILLSYSVVFIKTMNILQMF